MRDSPTFLMFSSSLRTRIFYLLPPPAKYAHTSGEVEVEKSKESQFTPSASRCTSDISEEEANVDKENVGNNTINNENFD